jgi:hypothetical protein
LPARQLPFGHDVIAVIPKSSFRGDAERRTRNPEVVAEIAGSRWRAPRNDVPGSEGRSADERTITVRDNYGERNKMADYALAHPPYARPLLPFLRDEAGSSSWPGLSRPSTSFSPPESKTWMPGTSAGSKASSPRPGTTEKVQEVRLCAQRAWRRSPGGAKRTRVHRLEEKTSAAPERRGHPVRSR